MTALAALLDEDQAAALAAVAITSRSHPTVAAKRKAIRAKSKRTAGRRARRKRAQARRQAGAER